MNLSEDVELEDYIARPDKISGADINAICQEDCLTYFVQRLHYFMFLLSFVTF